MATYKISQLTTATAVSATNQFEINQNGTSKSVEVSVIDVYIKSISNLPVVVSVSSASDALRITQTGTGNVLVVEDSANPDATPFVINASGDVGIGTSSPSYQLTIQGTGQETANLTDAGLKGGSLFLRATAVGAGSGGAVLFGTTFGNLTPFAAIKGFITNGTTNTVGHLTFSTRNTITDTSLTERFRIGTEGQLGIGGANYGTSGQVLTSGGSAAAPSWTTVGTVTATGRLINTQAFTSSGTYTRTAGVTTAVVIAVGGGGGGKGVNGGVAGGNGGNGGTTSFGAHVTAAGGTGSAGSQGGAGGTGGTSATIAIPGQGGGTGLNTQNAYFGGIGGGQGGGRSTALGAAGTAGSRGGGGSGGTNSACCTQFGGGGGGQGETGIKYTTTVGATETVTIGAGGTAGTGSGAPGGAGGAGYIIVYEYS